MSCGVRIPQQISNPAANVFSMTSNYRLVSAICYLLAVATIWTVIGAVVFGFLGYAFGQKAEEDEELREKQEEAYDAVINKEAEGN